MFQPAGTTTVVVSFTLALLLGACGGGAERAPAEPEETAAEPPLTLAEACKKIEAERPNTDFGFPTNKAQRGAFASFALELRDVAVGMDAEGAEVVEDFAEAVEDVSTETDGLVASEKIDVASGYLRDSCEGAGSPIWQ